MAFSSTGQFSSSLTGSQAGGLVAGTVGDIFAGFASMDQMAGDEAEQHQYLLASQYALQEEKYTKMSTAIQENQADRALYMSMGQTQSEVAGAGLSASGSSLDILRESASQGALQHAVIGEQGLITEQGYKEQAQAYATMASAAGDAAKAANLSSIGSFAAAGVSMATLALA